VPRLDKNGKMLTPSPHQQKVLDALADLQEILDFSRQDLPGIPLDDLVAFMKEQKIGSDYRPTGKFWPWHRSTVRDHLNQLIRKGFVTKIVTKKAYYRTAGD
jgi:hypothetical protein